MRYDQVMLGADPEVFLIESTGKFISSIGKIGGSKMFPRSIGDGAAVQEDNVAVEFNIAPSHTKQDFIKNLYKPINYLESFAKDLGLSLAIVPCATFSEDQLLDDGAKTFGCDPDYNAWTGKRNDKPSLPESQQGFRTCGGHLHVSWRNPSQQAGINLIKSLDLFLGVPSVLLDPDKERRILYGKAGAFRFKSYGVEYRTLSNFWIKSEEKMSWVYDQAMKAIAFAEAEPSISPKLERQIQRTINMSSQKMASLLSKEFSLGV